MYARRAGHVFVDHFTNTECRHVRPERQGRPDIPRECGVGQFRVQGEAAASERGGIDAPESYIRVGHGGRLAALAVAGRARLRAGTFRADYDASHGIDMCHRAAAGADFNH